MWPDDVTKSNPIFLKKVSPKVATAVLLNFCQFLNSQKVTRNLGNFCKKNCHAELLKIAQSGHSAYRSNLLGGNWSKARNPFQKTKQSTSFVKLSFL